MKRVHVWWESLRQKWIEKVEKLIKNIESEEWNPRENLEGESRLRNWREIVPESISKMYIYYLQINKHLAIN